MKLEKRNIIIRIIKLLSPYKWEFAKIFLLLIISTVLGFVQPLLIKEITDGGMLQGNITALLRAAFALSVVLLLNHLIDLAQVSRFADIHNTVYSTLFHETFQKLLHLKKEYYEDKNNAEILNFLQLDVSEVASVTDQYSVLSICDFFRIISGLLGLLIISWKLTLVVLLMIPIKLVSVTFFSKRQETVMEKSINQSGDFARWFGDKVNGIDEIKLWNLYEKMDKVFFEKLRRVLQLSKKGAMVNGWEHFWSGLLEWCITIVLYIIGGLFVCKGKLSIGAVFAFISYSGYVTGPISSLINLKMVFARVAPSAKRLFDFLDLETESSEQGIMLNSQATPKVELSNISFSYDSDRIILKNVNFSVEPGQKVAIIGSNGSGKSTIINLLLRFYEPTSGTILLDGKDAHTIDLAEYRSLFSVVSQNPYLFLGSIGENINLSEISDAGKLSYALCNSGVDKCIAKFPNGENTQIGYNGSKLSGGEKQKVAVARALLKDAPIVIFDEASSGFDVESAAHLRNVMEKEMKEKTVIVITHHYIDLTSMDKIYRLEDGVLHEVLDV